MDKSTHKIEVVRIGKLEKHPNADALSIVNVFGGYPCVVRTAEWAEGDRAAYVPPDTLVPLDRPEFAWLRDTGRTPKVVNGREYHLVRVAKLRKQPSMGLLVRVPADYDPFADAAGDGNLTTYFEALHYEPPQKGANTSKGTTYGSAAEPAPSNNPPTYDLDALRRYADVLQPGEPVYITEKIHGANARYTAEDRGFFSFSRRRGNVSIRFGSRVFTWQRGRGFKSRKLDASARFMRVGSRNQWKRPDPNDIWWRALAGLPQLAEFCKSRPGWTVYGEVYGDVQDLDYGVPQGEVRFVAFDVLTDEREWLEPGAFQRLMAKYRIPTPPVLAPMGVPFYLDNVLAMAEGPSLLCAINLPTALKSRAHVREGIVVKPMQERRHPAVGRVALKVVGTGYYERAA